MSWKPLNNWSLAFRLTAWYTLAGIAMAGTVMGLQYFTLATELKRANNQFLDDKVNVLRALLRERPDDRDALREEVELESAARRYEQFYIRILDETGRLIMCTPGMEKRLPSDRFVPGGPKPLWSSGEMFDSIEVSLRAGKERRLWKAQVAVELAEQTHLLDRYRMSLWIILGAVLLVAPLTGFEIARRSIRPLQKVSETARRIGSTTLGERIEPEGYPVEIAVLAKTFNAMLDRLEDSFARLSDFSADIAHELRTPVNNIRGETEVALARPRSPDEYREVLGSCLEEAVRLSEIIGSLLFLARAESPGMHLKRETVEIEPLLQGVCDYYDTSASEAGLRIRAECAGPLHAELDRSLMQRALVNLVSNAVAHTSAGGSVTLSARGEAAGVRIQVADTGGGIPPEALPRVFDRFYRVDPVRSQGSRGTGLGLAIVRGIVKLHGGNVEIQSALGVGTTVILNLVDSSLAAD